MILQLSNKSCYSPENAESSASAALTKAGAIRLAGCRELNYNVLIRFCYPGSCFISVKELPVIAEF